MSSSNSYSGAGHILLLALLYLLFKKPTILRPLFIQWYSYHDPDSLRNHSGNSVIFAAF